MSVYIPTTPFLPGSTNNHNNLNNNYNDQAIQWDAGTSQSAAPTATAVGTHFSSSVSLGSTPITFRPTCRRTRHYWQVIVTNSETEMKPNRNHNKSLPSQTETTTTSVIRRHSRSFNRQIWKELYSAASMIQTISSFFHFHFQPLSRSLSRLFPPPPHLKVRFLLGECRWDTSPLQT